MPVCWYPQEDRGVDTSDLTSSIKLQVFKGETTEIFVFLRLLICLSQNNEKLSQSTSSAFQCLCTLAQLSTQHFLYSYCWPGSISHRWSLRTFPVCRFLRGSKTFHVSTYKRLRMHLLSANPWRERREKENMSNIIVLIPEYGRS